MALRAGDCREKTHVPHEVQGAPSEHLPRPKPACLKEFMTQIPVCLLKHRGILKSHPRVLSAWIVPKSGHPMPSPCLHHAFFIRKNVPHISRRVLGAEGSSFPRCLTS